MSDKTKARKSWLLELFQREKAGLLELEKYEVKEGDAIETDEDGKVQGDVKDGEYELTDGSTLVVKDGVATKKAAEATDAPEAEKAADATDTASGDTAPADETTEPTLADVLAAVNALAQTVTELVGGLGLQKQEAEKATTELSAVSQRLAELEKKPAVQKPAVGLGLSQADEKPLTRAEQEFALAKLLRGN